LLSSENPNRGFKMRRSSRTYTIRNDNVDLYEIKKNKLPCIECLVRPTCFREKKATKKAKYLRYTVELEEPCFEAFLIMDLIDLHADYFSVVCNRNDLQLDVDSLFNNAVCYFNKWHPKFINDVYFQFVYTSYFLFLNVIDRDPYYVKNGTETAYNYLGMIFQDYFKVIDWAINLYSKSINLTPNNSRSFENRGFCYLKKQDLNNGLADLNKSKIMSDGQDLKLNEIIKDVENRINGKIGKSEFDSLYI
jgi:hypothetical protein